LAVFQKLYPTIDKALQMLLEKNYTSRVRRAWREFFVLMVDGMKTSMAVESEHASLDTHRDSSGSLRNGCPVHQPFNQWS
jgi:hypothetical protein